MSEYEIQQLIVGSRYEFDVATLAYMTWALVFIFLCAGNERSFSKTGATLIAGLYLTGSGLLILRCIASMVRMAKQNALLGFDPQFVVTNYGLQLPTLVMRYALFLLAPSVVLYFMREAVRRKRQD